MTEQAKTESTSLVVIQPTDVRAFFVENKNLDSILAEIETLATNFEPDVSTSKGRKLIGSQAYSVARTKTFIDGLGKELVDAEKEIPKRIDATRKRVRDFCDELQARVRQPLTDFENAEKSRIADLDFRLNGIREFGQVAQPEQQPSEQIKAWLDKLEIIAIDDTWDEYKDRAQIAKDAAKSTLEAALQSRLTWEAQQAEIERLKAEQVKRNQENRVRQIAEQARHEAEQKALREKIESEQREQAAKDAQVKAEREAIEAKERLAREQQESAERERLAAERAAEQERQRIAQEEANLKAEEERRAADVEHRRTINRAVIAAIMAADTTITAAQAEAVMKAIVLHKIPNTSIQY